MVGGLNIAALAQRTGVAADTLRKWEQRYAILRPTRTAGGQRRYTERDVARVEWLTARLAEGYRIGEAALLLGADDDPATETPAEHAEAILEAAAAADAQRISRLLDQAFAIHPLEIALLEVVKPVLERVGSLWAKHELSVADEHLVSATIRGRLDVYLSDARGSVRGSAVLACAPGERHELGLLMLAVLLRADGWNVAYLGADTPFDEAIDLTERLDGRFLAVSVTMREQAAGLEKALRGRSNGRPPVVLGGSGATQAIATRVGAQYLDGDPRKAVKSLQKLGEQ